MTTYTLQALDADDNVRETLGVEGVSVGKLFILHVPQHWPASEREALAQTFAQAAPKGVHCIVVPDYVRAFRLVEVQPELPAEWTGEADT